MADVEHVLTQHADCHEPKHITISTTADAGKVITPSSSNSGQSVLRYLNISEIDSTGIASGNLLASNGAGGIVGVTSSNTIAASSLVSTSLSIPTGSFVKIPFSNIDYQTGPTWSITSNSLVIPEDGTYKLEYHISAKVDIASDQLEKTFFVTAGLDDSNPTVAATIKIGEDAGVDPATGYITVSDSVYLDFVETDQVSVYISSDSVDGTTSIHKATMILSRVN